jgi:thioredoxin-like negative regulator of GroEL
MIYKYKENRMIIMSVYDTVTIESEEVLDDFTNQNRYILYFSSEKCSVCNTILPELEEITRDAPIQIGKIDVNKNLKIAGQYLIFVTPTIIIFNDGKEILRESRFIDFKKIERMLELLL